MSKIKSYLGFCQKAGDLVIVYNNLEKTKKGVFLIIIDNNLGESTTKKVKKFAINFGCEMLICQNLTFYLGKEIKVVALKNQSLAKAIMDNLDQNFTLIPKEVTNG